MGETKKYHFEKNYKCVVQICEKQVMTEDEECLSEMLGGISFDGAAWKEDIEDDTTKPKLLHGRVDPVALKGKLSKKRSVERSVPPETETLPSEDNNDESIFQNAYCYTSRGTERPHVRICNVLKRGKALVATRYIKKGTCLYTEKAIVATQVTNMEGEWPPSIKACQYCFCSLESSLAISDSMPYPDLWPVPSLSFPTLQDDRKCQNDNNGRVKCADCQALFCSKNCFSMQNKEYGSCCYLTKMVKLHQRDKNHCLNEAPVALAARLFCHVTNFYRTHHELRNHYIFGFCGEANELTQLEIGYERVAQDTIGYTLEPLYASLIDVLAVSSTEQKTLSLDLLHSLASKAQRNGFAIRTQSPFKPYYSSLLRKSGGQRYSEQHQKNMEQIAKALGKSQLERGMDRLIEEKVAPEISSMFVLTARINHSCQPNAQVMAQEFVDARIDLVAIQDIVPGEEILISYIQCRKKSTVQRRRELQTKYLFTCDCIQCSGQG